MPHGAARRTHCFNLPRGARAIRPRLRCPPPTSLLPYLLRDAYDPNFRGQKATKDQVVHYPYDRLGCPDLVYYDTPWKPVVEM